MKFINFIILINIFEEENPLDLLSHFDFYFSLRKKLDSNFCWYIHHGKKAVQSTIKTHEMSSILLFFRSHRAVHLSIFASVTPLTPPSETKADTGMCRSFR